MLFYSCGGLHKKFIQFLPFFGLINARRWCDGISWLLWFFFHSLISSSFFSVPNRMKKFCQDVSGRRKNIHNKLKLRLIALLHQVCFLLLLSSKRLLFSTSWNFNQMKALSVVYVAADKFELFKFQDMFQLFRVVVHGVGVGKANRNKLSSQILSQTFLIEIFLVVLFFKSLIHCNSVIASPETIFKIFIF